MESKRKNVYITIFVITTILASCAAVYFGIKGEREKKELENKLANVSTSTNEQSNTENNNNDNLNSTENSLKPDNKLYSLINVAEKLDEEYYLVKSMPTLNQGIKAKVQNGKAYVTNLDDSLGIASYKNEKGKFYEIQNVKGDVVDICITKIPTSGYPIFILLMSDGTIQKTKFVEGSNIVCEGKIEGYKDVVRIDNVQYEEKNNFGDEVVIKYSDGISITKNDGTVEILKNVF